MVMVVACASMLFSTNSAIALSGLLCDSAMIRIAFQSSPILSLPRSLPLVAIRVHSATATAGNRQALQPEYIIEGSGAMWLGSERKEFKPGTLIIIPKGTAHGATLVTSGPVKAIAIKIPPQPPGDTVLMD